MDDTRSRASPRLQFTKEELENPALERPIAKAEKAAKKAEKAKRRLPVRHRLKLTTEEAETAEQTTHADPGNMVVSTSAEMHDTDQAEGLASDNAIRTDPKSPGVRNTRQRVQIPARAPCVNTRTARTQGESTFADHTTFNTETAEAVGIASPASVSSVAQTAGSPASSSHAAKKKKHRLKWEETPAKPPSRLTHTVEKTVRTAGDQLHRQAAQSNEDDNVAVEAVLKADDVKASTLQMGEHAYHAKKLHAYRKAERAESRLDRANLRVLEEKQRQENPQFTSNPYSRWQQKRAIRREYAAAKRSAGRAATQQTARKAEQAVEKTEEAAVKAASAVKRHPKGLAILALLTMLLMVFSMLQSCTPLAQSVLESLVIGTYPAEEEDVRAAERAYLAKEKELKDEMDHYERYHPGYDEYHVDAQEIWHDPYVLIAIISAYYDGQDWTIDTAMPVIEKYFALQYIVTETVTTETRYRSERQTGTRLVTDPDTGTTSVESYSEEVSVPYTYTICNVKLENKNLSHLPVVSMSHHTMGMYALYMATHGNMEGIFTGKYATPLRDPMLYDIPQETLDADPTFARLMEEAEKYIGYPYVWGGSSPETSFDCSGFVSYVFTNSGVYNTGRLGAKGLRSLCRNVPDDQVRPGDIVFFEGTMGDGVEGITHCGIYVGNNMMIHCGSPIGYANLTDSYWRQHFHSFGRVPN